MTGKKRVRSMTVAKDREVKEDPPEKKTRLMKQEVANIRGKTSRNKEPVSATTRSSSSSTNKQNLGNKTLSEKGKKNTDNKPTFLQEKTTRIKPESRPQATEEEKSKYFLDKGTKQNGSRKHVGKSLVHKNTAGDRIRSNNPTPTAASVKRGAVKVKHTDCDNKEIAVKKSKVKSQPKEDQMVSGDNMSGDSSRTSVKDMSSGRIGAKSTKKGIAKSPRATAAKSVVTTKRCPPTAAKGCPPTATRSVTDSKQGSKEAQRKVSGIKTEHGGEEESDSEESDDSDWEEVEELPGVESQQKVQLPKEPVVITLEAPPALGHKKKKGQFDFATYLKRQLNRAEKELHEDMHKTHLLCLLSHGFHRNRLCNCSILQAMGLSLVPCEMAESLPVFWDVPFLKKFASWFLSSFHIKADLKERNETLVQTLMDRFTTGRVASVAELVYVCIIILRSLGADVRLVYSLNAVSHKPSSKVTVLPEKWKKILEHQGFKVPDDLKQLQGCNTETKPDGHLNPSNAAGVDRDMKLMQTECNRTSKLTSTGGKCGGPDTTKTAKTAATPQPKNRKPRTCASKVKGPEVVTLSDESDDDVVEIPSKYSVTKGERTEQEETKKQLSSRKSRSGGKRNIVKVESNGSEDSDFEIEEIKFRKSPSLQKRGRGTGKRKDDKKKVVSSDSDDVEVTKVVDADSGCNYWLEVYLERMERWVCLDCVRARVNRPAEMEQHASQPIRYVLAYDNHHGVKDVTQRYASGWMSQTRRLRIDEPWWEAVLAPFTPRNKAQDQTETLSFQAQHMRKPLPTVVGEYKNHPLYALKRHLLKFEAIYPDSAVPAGYVRGEPVYSRDCVHELHTRETWVREGRAVRVKETPYKMVKARKKKNAKSFESGSEEKMAEVFGRWQTEQYMPPPAYDGKVPRNEYGNVEVFKPWMIPAGSVHLQIPGLNKVARKLNIDCAPAMTGWDFHGGYNHPILDGFIVCEEFKDVLLAAWDEQQEIDRERDREKREKRALSNWKLLTKGLVIKERLKKRFDLQERETPPGGASGSGCQATERKADDVSLSWPLNRQTENAAGKPVGHVSFFPSEEL